MVRQAVSINLREKRHKILEKMVRGTHTPLHFIKRAEKEYPISYFSFLLRSLKT